MISNETAALIEALLNPEGQVGYASEYYRKALEEFREDRRRATEAAVTDAGLDPAMEQRRADERTVEYAVTSHLQAALRLSRQAPLPGDTWPDARLVKAQWHLMRAQLLRALPVELAAAHLAPRPGEPVTVETLAQLVDETPGPGKWPRMSMVHGGRRYMLELQPIPLGDDRMAEMVTVYLDGRPLTQHMRYEP